MQTNKDGRESEILEKNNFLNMGLSHSDKENIKK